jgi:hypothetical protein
MALLVLTKIRYMRSLVKKTTQITSHMAMRIERWTRSKKGERESGQMKLKTRPLNIGHLHELKVINKFIWRQPIPTKKNWEKLAIFFSLQMETQYFISCHPS